MTRSSASSPALAQQTTTTIATTTARGGEMAKRGSRATAALMICLVALFVLHTLITSESILTLISLSKTTTEKAFEDNNKGQKNTMMSMSSSKTTTTTTTTTTEIKTIDDGGGGGRAPPTTRMKNNNNNDNNKTESCGAPDRTPHMKTVYNWWDAPFDTFTEIKGTIETDLAICKFERQTEEPLNTVFKITHFPHVMQVMYMCFSHWSKHPDKLPVLYLHQSNETYTNPLRGAFSKNAFLKGFLAMLESGMNLEVWSEKQIRWWLSENHHGTDDGTDDGDVDFEFLEATQPRGYAFSHPEILSKISVDYFAHRQRRRKIEGEENRDDNDNDDAGGGGAWTCPAPRIGILNRKGTRSFENLDDLERHLETSRQLYDPDDDDGRGLLPLVPPEVSSIYFENATFSEQVGFFHSVDILLTSHGAQSTGLPFLANTACPHFIEIFPESYVMPGFFGTLSTYSEIRYSYFHVSSSSSLSGADDDDVELPPTTDYNDDDSFNLDNDHSIHDTDLKKEKLPVIILETTRERIRSRSTNFCVDRYAVAYSLRNALLDWCVCQKDLLL